MRLTILGMREKVDGEIIPARAEQSATKNNDDVKHGAERAIDMNSSTKSTAVPGSDGNTWLKITLDQVHCVQRVLRYRDSDDLWQTWICPESGCSCVGRYCSAFTLTVSTEGASTDLSPVSDCKHGDTVKYERVSGDVGAYEMVIIGLKGTSNITKSNLIQRCNGFRENFSKFQRPKSSKNSGLYVSCMLVDLRYSTSLKYFITANTYKHFSNKAASCKRNCTS